MPVGQLVPPVHCSIDEIGEGGYMAGSRKEAVMSQETNGGKFRLVVNIYECAEGGGRRQVAQKIEEFDAQDRESARLKTDELVAAKLKEVVDRKNNANGRHKITVRSFSHQFEVSQQVTENGVQDFKSLWHKGL